MSVELTAEMIEVGAKALGHYSDTTWTHWKDTQTAQRHAKRVTKVLAAVLPLIRAKLADGLEAEDWWAASDGSGSFREDASQYEIGDNDGKIRCIEWLRGDDRG